MFVYHPTKYYKKLHSTTMITSPDSNTSTSKPDLMETKSKVSLLQYCKPKSKTNVNQRGKSKMKPNLKPKKTKSISQTKVLPKLKLQEKTKINLKSQSTMKSKQQSKIQSKQQSKIQSKSKSSSQSELGKSKTKLSSTKTTTKSNIPTSSTSIIKLSQKLLKVISVSPCIIGGFDNPPPPPTDSTNRTLQSRVQRSYAKIPITLSSLTILDNHYDNHDKLSSIDTPLRHLTRKSCLSNNLVCVKGVSVPCIKCNRPLNPSTNTPQQFKTGCVQTYFKCEQC